MTTLQPPAAGEYGPYYAGYLEQVPAGDILEILRQSGERLSGLLANLSEEEANFRYDAGKWSIKELLGHLIDTERLFAFRALWIARQDPSPQPGMEQDDWVRSGDFDQRALGDLLAEYRAVRQASLTLFRGFSGEMVTRTGTANQVTFSVRAFPYLIAGHELHHEEVLRDRYLPI
jgi:hypothetical protein